MNVGLVSCVSKKKPGMLKVRDKYDSALFKKSLRYSLNNFDKTFVLSALHGLLDLDVEIDDYNVTLKRMGKEERFVWAGRVAEQIKSCIEIGSSLNFICGKAYYKDLLFFLKDYKVNIIMEGLPIGKRLQWLSK